MSSAAIQAAPQTTTAPGLNTPPLLSASPASRHHYASSTHSSPTREGYHASHLQPTGASPSSRHSRRPSANDTAANPHSSSPASQSNSPMSSRAAISSPVAVASPVQPQEHQTAASERRRHHHAPPVAPPRTSSNQHGPNGAQGSGSSSRRPGASNDRSQNSPRRGVTEREHNSSSEHHGGSQGEQSSSSSRRRERQHHTATPQDIPQRGGSSRDGRVPGSSTTMAIRPHPHHHAGGQATASSSKGPSREASEILNSILVSPPEEDIERERERLVQAQPHPVGVDLDYDDAAPPPIVATDSRAARSRHDNSGKREKHTKFGEYILGNTIGEGEFGKVKLGWKQEGGVQVAIKLIKKDALGSNPTRMAKIMREVAILKQLTHPNIVRLHKMEESERHYGIVLEYASGGELFDYILTHRYLKDNAARRLFAQLVSGVGYLHKKGIVHRDLKLENLLLDRNRNIIITDFGFANTFDPNEDLTEEEEQGLVDRDFVKRMGLDKLKPNNTRKGDLMQTSCGSPCYAAPELVVSDSLYTGRKVDVWSCGVILYAMLAGYLPFDDDPANPEGDNINLLYKYIVNTPLTFPEYVTPHAKDLLRRILVPNPRRRADLFEVARHSWLSEFAHVVEFITSSTTTHVDIQNTTVTAEDAGEGPSGLARSASVRETSRKTPTSPTLGGLVSKQGGLDQEAEAAHARQQKDNKRRTVQVEYVAPNTQTQRGEPPNIQSTSGKTRARSGSEGPIEVTASQSSPKNKPLPRDPPVSKDAYAMAAVRGDPRKPPSSHRNQVVPTRPHRDGPRVASDTGYVISGGPSSAARPATGGSMNSTGSLGFGAGARASYGQPLPPTLAGTNVHGRIQQPTSSAKHYVPTGPSGPSGPSGQDSQNLDYGRPSISVPPKFAKVSGFSGEGELAEQAEGNKGHRRSNTLGEITGKVFGRSGSLFGNKSRKKAAEQQQSEPKPSRKYPPVSMSSAAISGEYEPRHSVESKRSRRSFSFGLGKRRSGSMAGSQTSQEKQTRRFSFIPGSISLKAIGIGKDTPPPAQDSQQDLPIQEPPHFDQYGRYADQQQVDQRVAPHDVDAAAVDGMYAQLHDPQQAAVALSNSLSSPGTAQTQFAAGQYDQYDDRQQQQQRPSAIPNYMQHGAVLTSGSESSVNDPRRVPNSAPYHQNYHQQQQQENQRISSSHGVGAGRGNRGVLQKNKRFVDAYDTDEYSNRAPDHGGSSGAARRVMDFFRRRGKARGGEDR